MICFHFICSHWLPLAQSDLLPTRNAHDGGKMSHYALYAFLKSRVRDGDEFDAERYAEMYADAMRRFHGAGELHHFVARGFDAGFRSCWVRARWADGPNATKTERRGGALQSERREPLRFCL